MAQWADLVTTALLGTDRRTVPEELSGAWADGRSVESDPARLVLGLAARRRAAARAGGLLRSCSPASAAPPRDPVANEAATELLEGLLVRPSPALVGLWLRAAVSRGVTVSPEHWARLAAIAARDPGLDRTLLAAALGPRGVWFVAQNPQWSRLSVALGSPDRPAPAGPATAGPAPAGPGADPGGSAAPRVAEVEANPWLLAEVADPWPADLLLAGLRVIATARLGYRGVAYAGLLGARLPLVYRRLVDTAIETLGVGYAGGGFTAERLVRDCFDALQAAVEARLAIAAAFEDDPRADSTRVGRDEDQTPDRDRGANR